MKYRLIAPLLLPYVLLVLACTPQGTQLVQPPTLMVLPSTTPTEAVTATALSTSPPTQTSSPTNNPTQTLTSPVTETQTPSPTLTPSLTITPTLTLSPTLTLTPVPSQIPIPSPTTFVPVQLSFNSAQDGMQPVIGPVSIPSGVYRVTAITAGFIIAEIETMSGECVTSSTGPLFALFQGRASMGAEALLVSNQCEALIQISNTSVSWSLTLEEIDLETSTQLSSQYTSDQLGMEPVIGPIAIPNGTYRVTASTSGFLIVTVETVRGTCNSGFGPLFALMQGQGEGGAQEILRSEDCIAFFILGNSSEPWSLSFEKLN